MFEEKVKGIIFHYSNNTRLKINILGPIVSFVYFELFEIIYLIIYMCSISEF